MADYSKGSITLTGPDGPKTYESIKAKCEGGAKVLPLDITHNGIFEAAEGEGYSPINVNVPVQGGSLKNLLDTTKSTHFLFYYYDGSNIDGLINYDDTSNVTDMQSMFYNCRSLTTIPLFDTSNVTNMLDMFHNCYSLTTIPLFDTSNVTDMQGMFYNCRSLTTIIIKNTTKIPPLSTTSFTSCYHFTGTVNSQYNPEGLKDGRIYVPDDKVEEFKTATNWSVFAELIVPLSTYKE